MPASDELLQPYLECPDEQSAEAVLGELLFARAEPLVRGILSRRLGGSAGPQDQEDLSGEVILELLVRLRKSRHSGESPIESFRAYVLAVAHHACDAFFRRLYPQRHRLKNRIRYVLRADPRFALWNEAGGAAVGGWARWQGQTAVVLSSVEITPAPSARLDSTLETVFDAAGGPLELDELTGVLASAWGIRDARLPLDTAGRRAGAGPDPATILDQRRRLERLWAGIVELPPPQRVALLLHLRDEGGGPVLHLLPASGVASVHRIAEVLRVLPKHSRRREPAASPTSCGVP